MECPYCAELCYTLYSLLIQKGGGEMAKSPVTLNRERQIREPLDPARLLYARRLLPVMIPKAQLRVGAYYVGACRNASVARWTGTEFRHWRRKFGIDFIETIRHPEDDQTFDCFVPVWPVDGGDDALGVTPIPLADAHDETPTT